MYNNKNKQSKKIAVRRENAYNHHKIKITVAKKNSANYNLHASAGVIQW